MSQTFTDKPLLGGLNNKLPPTMLAPHVSPDLLNVVFTDGAVEKRPGFSPMFKDRLFMNAVKNSSYKTNAVAESGGSNVDYIRVYGALYAGHRAIYEGQTELTVELFHQVADELPTQTGSDGSTSSTMTISVRPLLSKGPVKRTNETATSPECCASIAWNTTETTVWGNHSLSGMPFCVYLYNNSGTWEFRVSAHYYNVGGSATWSLQTAASTEIVYPGARYHIQASMSATAIKIRVGRIKDGEATTYSTVSTAISTGQLAWNRCPIMLFDCPQLFVDKTATGSGTVRPGLGIGLSLLGTSTRAEGLIEDVVIWGSDKDIAAGTLDRVTKLSPATGMLNYWPMLKGGRDYTEDACGRGNSLYLVPNGPAYDPGSGGIESASYFFNGVTSYAQINLGAYSPWYRWCKYSGLSTPSAHGAFTFNVLNGKPHGMAVEFWVDSIEPQFEQVVAEIHGCLRLAINTSGFLVVYCRTSGTPGDTYQVAATGTTALQPGQRYSVAVMRLSGTQVSIYLNGVLHEAASGLTATSSSGNGVGGITLGMGSWEILNRSAAGQFDGTMASINYINTDSRSGFFGRIEKFRILCGTNAQDYIPYNKSAETESDWVNRDNRVWQNASGSTALQPKDAGDVVKNNLLGYLARIDDHNENDDVMAYAISTTTGTNQYNLHTATFDLQTNTLRRGHEGTITAVGVRFYHSVGVFFLNEDPRKDQVLGFYQTLEYRYNAASTTHTLNTLKSVHVQRSPLQDKTGFCYSLDLHCSESDVLWESDTQIYTTRGRLRNRPFEHRSPFELRPKFTAGIVRPQPGQCDVTLLADWEQQEAQERYIITASGRNIYWARPVWVSDAPFVEDLPICLSFPGGYGSFVKHPATINGMVLSGTAPKSTAVIEAWLKPRRVDGRRLFASKVDLSTSRVNWAIAMRDGALEVFGTEGSGARLWTFTEGIAGTTDVQLTPAVRANVWNHVHVTIGPGATGIQVRVNGKLVPMVDNSTLSGANDKDAYDNGVSDAASAAVYIGGLPLGLDTLRMPVTATGTTTQWRFASLDCRMAEFRVRETADTANWPTDGSGYPPTERIRTGEDLDDNTVCYLPMDDGDGWNLSDESNIPEKPYIDFKEFKLIAEDMEESSGSRYEAVAFRDRLFITNGKSDPHQIRVSDRLADPPLVVERLGLATPIALKPSISAVTVGSGTIYQTGTYQVYMTCVTFDGHESDPVFMQEYALGSTCDELYLKLTDVPRSIDPQVVARNFYCSPPGGGLPIFTRTMTNDGSAVDLTSPTAGAGTLTSGNALPAPRAKHIAVAGASITLADLVDEPAGQNAVAFSSPSDAASFTVTSIVTMDSEDGKPIIGVKGNLGQFYVSKRDSIYSVAVGAIVTAESIDASIRQVLNSDGCGGGGAAVNGLIYGAGDRGVFAFDGTTPLYLSESVERLWRDEVDRSDSALKLMQGVYVRQRSEYWLSVKLQTKARKDRVLTLKVGQEGQWTLAEVPEHVTMAILESPLRQTQRLAIGTFSGLILWLDPDSQIDGADDHDQGSNPVTISGTHVPVTYVLSGTATSLTIPSGTFTTIGGGLAGAKVKLVYGLYTAERYITRNVSRTIYWDEPLPNWSSYTSFEIGGYHGYWTTPYLADGPGSGEQEVSHIDLEMLPQAGIVTVDLVAIRQAMATARSFPTASMETWTIDQTQGWTQTPERPRSHARGHYHRVRIGTDGANKPFALVGLNIRNRQMKAIGHTGRTS